jgi:uncharacterized membrane protein (DUF485 family)
MNDLEPDYRKEYEELLKKVEFFAEIMTLVAVVGLVALLLNIIVRSI